MGPYWRWWAGRAILLMGAVYLLGLAGVPTFIPYVAALLTVILDGIRTARRAVRARVV